MLTKSFSPRVSRMVLMVCLAMVSLSPFMLPLTSTTITRSFGEVAAWIYLERTFLLSVWADVIHLSLTDRQCDQSSGLILLFVPFPSSAFAWLFKLISINGISSTPAAIGIFPDSNVPFFPPHLKCLQASWRTHSILSLFPLRQACT